jgi:hypothetical protein
VLLALGVRESPAVEEAPPAGTSKPVPSLWEEEDPVAALRLISSLFLLLMPT